MFPWRRGAEAMTTGGETINSGLAFRDLFLPTLNKHCLSPKALFPDYWCTGRKKKKKVSWMDLIKKKTFSLSCPRGQHRDVFISRSLRPFYVCKWWKSKRSCMFSWVQDANKASWWPALKSVHFESMREICKQLARDTTIQLFRANGSFCKFEPHAIL